MKNGYENLIGYVCGYPYISFDVFDTLIFRTVSNPSGILFIVEEMYLERYKQSIKTFHIKRLYAGAIASALYGEKVNINQIYNHIDYPQNVAERLKELEIEAEIRNAIPNKPMVLVLNKCRAAGKKIVITSDMYLTKDVFDAIFDKIGVQYDYLFISGEIGYSKRSGVLFGYVLKKLNISSDKIIHIGDDIHNDIQMPNQYGIRSFERIQDEPRKLDFYLPKHKTSCISNYMSSLFTQATRNMIGQNTLLRVGYTVIGPFLYGFCKWLHEEKKRLELDSLMFIAREGYLIKQVYDIIYPEEKGSSHYIALNKNLLRLPSLTGENRIRKFLKSLPGWEIFSWQDIILYLDYDRDPKKSHSFFEYFSLDPNVTVTRSDLIAGIWDEQMAYLFDVYREDIEKQEQLLGLYLQQLGFIDKRVGLVNNSKNGNGQILLETIAKEKGYNVDLWGLQFVASNSCKKKLKDRVKTYFRMPQDLTVSGELFFSNSLLFEHLLFPQSGTARALAVDDNGKVSVKCEDIGVEDYNKHSVGTIQEFVLQFASDYRNNLDLDIEVISKAMICNFYFFPYAEDALALGEIKDVEAGKIRQIVELKENITVMKILHPSFLSIWVSGVMAVLRKTRTLQKLWKWRTEFRSYFIIKTANFQIDFMMGFRLELKRIFELLTNPMIQEVCKIKQSLRLRKLVIHKI